MDNLIVLIFLFAPGIFSETSIEKTCILIKENNKEVYFDGDEENYKKAKNKKFSCLDSLNNIFVNTRDTFNVKDHVAYLDSIKLEQFLFLETWEHKLPPLFYEVEKSQITCDIFRLQFTWYDNACRFKNITWACEKADWLRRTHWITQNDTSVLVKDFYRTLEWYLWTKYEHDIAKEGLQKNMLGTYLYIKAMSHEKVRESVLQYFLLEYISAYGVEEGTFEAVNDFKNIATDTAALNQIDRLYKEKSSIIVGRDAPDFSFTDIEKKDCTLSQFIGKVVYLDFWSLGCKPCIRALQALPQVQQLFSDDDIVFIFISSDNSKSLKKYLKQHNIKGIHVPHTSEMEKVKTLYSVRSLPTNYLIGKDGRFLNTNPPQPGLHNNTDLIHQLKIACDAN